MRLTALLCVALLHGIVLAPLLHAGPLRVGAAQVEITPAPGSPHYRGTAKGAHDPLFARAMFFEQDGVSAALIVCDVLNVSVDLTASARKHIASKTGTPYEHISITATHTHTGPRGHNAPPDDPANAYARRVRDAIVHAVVQAKSKAQPVSLRHGVAAQSPTVSFNRRFYMKDGTVRMNPGFQNPNIVRPEGPIDPDLAVVLFEPVGGGPATASLTNFALHLDTVGGNLYSVDYPLYLHRAFAGLYGDTHVSLFGTGACGDLNHFDVSQPGPQRGHKDGHQTTQTIGRALATTVTAHAPKLSASPGSLAVRRAVVQAPLQTFTDKDIAWARGEIEAAKPTGERRFLIARRRMKLLSLVKLKDRWGPTIPLDVHAFRLGPDTAVVTLPGEVFTELSQSIKKASPFATTLVIELANDNIAYVPTRRGYENGDYEAINSRIQAGWGEKMADRAVGLLKALKAP